MEVQLEENNLLELLLSPSNLNAAYRQVVRNGGVGGVDKMETEQAVAIPTLHKDELLEKRYAGEVSSVPLRNLEIRHSSKTRPLGVADSGRPLLFSRQSARSVDTALRTTSSVTTASASRPRRSNSRCTA